MEYREIEAVSIDEAKIKIKREYGDRARIIKVVEAARGGFLGLGRKKFVRVLISISDEDLLKKYKENMGILTKGKNKRNKAHDREADPDYSASPLSALDNIVEKLNTIETKVNHSLASGNGFDHPHLLEVKQILKENEFFDDFIDSLINNLKENMPYSKINDKVEVHRFVYQYISDKLLIRQNNYQLKEKQIKVLVGPTGVGKTTTIAKIAANAIREKLKVELITIDGYRIGAKYQLEKYAEYMRTPMSGVEDNLELQKLIDLSEADLILIDTIGRSASDEMNLVKMKQLLRLERYFPEYILTISASTKRSDVKKIFKSFDLFDYRGVIITKLDETETIGAILNSAIDKEVEFNYVTNGQRVPNDISRAKKENLMRKIMGFDFEVYLNRMGMDVKSL